MQDYPTYNNTAEWWRDFFQQRIANNCFDEIMEVEEDGGIKKYLVPDWAAWVLHFLEQEIEQSKLSTNGLVPFWAVAVTLIMTKGVDNLQDVSFTWATEGYSIVPLRKTIECLQDTALQIAVYRCAAKEAKLFFDVHSKNGEDGEPCKSFIKYCNAQLEWLESRGEFELDNIMQADRARLVDVEKWLGEVESKLASIATQIPAELSSEDAQAILKRAVDAGLCEPQQGGRYKWLKTFQMLAYFAVRASDYLELTNRQYNGNYVTQWKPFALLFGVEANKLSRAKQDYQKGSNDKPKGYEAVDALFAKP